MGARLAIVAALVFAAALCGWLLRTDPRPAPLSDGGPRPASVGIGERALLEGRPAEDLASGRTETVQPSALPVAGSARLVIDVRLDGKPGLPGNQLVYLNDRMLAPNEIAEDPRKGQVLVDLPAGDPPDPSVRIEARGYLVSEARAAEMDARGTLRVAFDLHAGGRILVEGEMPADELTWVVLQSWTKGDWVSHPTSSASRVTFPGAMPEFFGLPAGRYRVVDAVTDTASEPYDVAPGKTVTARLDLSASMTYGGRVEAPPGENVGLARVFDLDRHGRQPPRLGLGQRQAPSRMPDFGSVGADGSFVLRGRRAERVRIGVVHPYLRPAPVDGTADVVVGLGEPVLRLVRGPEIRFRTEPLSVPTTPGTSQITFPSIRVVLRRPADGTSVPAVWHTPTPNGVGRIGVPQAGRWQVFLDNLQGRAPLDLLVDVGDETPDLGPLTFPAGSTLRVRIRSSGDLGPLILRVECREPVPYVRGGGADAASTDTFVVPGLGPGEHTLFVDQMFRAAAAGETGRTVGLLRLAERTVRADGVNDVAIDLEISAAGK